MGCALPTTPVSDAIRPVNQVLRAGEHKGKAE